MKIKAVLMLVFAVVLTIPIAAHAQSGLKANAVSHKDVAQSKLASATMYECPICRHKVSAAQAKSLHYTCPVDGGKLVRVKAVSLHKSH